MILLAVGPGAVDGGRVETAAGARGPGRVAYATARRAARSGRAAVLRSERRRKASTKAIVKRDQEAVAEGAELEEVSISRQELLEKALRIIAKDLSQEGDKRPTNTIGNLVQLLKLDRSFREDEEQPHEIRVVWEEKRDETFNDSAGSFSEDRHED